MSDSAALALGRLPPAQRALLQGKVIWLSGAASGIGRSLALALAISGSKLVLGDLNERGLMDLAAEVSDLGGEAVHARCDVTSWESQLALFDLGFSRFGAIDAVLPNAGVALGEGFVQKTETGAPVKPSLRTMNINLTSVLYSSALAFHYLPLVKKSLLPLPNPLLSSATSSELLAPLKALILTGSMASLFGTSPEDVEYSASKAGVLGILHGLRERCDDEDIRLAMVAPYFVQTPLLPDGFEPPLGWTKLEDVLLAFLLALTSDPWTSHALPSPSSTAATDGSVTASSLGVTRSSEASDESRAEPSRNGSVFAIPGGNKGVVILDKRGLMPLGWVQAAAARRRQRGGSRGTEARL